MIVGTLIIPVSVSTISEGARETKASSPKKSLGRQRRKVVDIPVIHVIRAIVHVPAECLMVPHQHRPSLLGCDENLFNNPNQTCLWAFVCCSGLAATLRQKAQGLGFRGLGV